MKKIFIFCLLLLVAFIGFLINKPILIAPHPTYRADSIVLAGNAKHIWHHDYRVFNLGLRSSKINRVVVSCGCTHASCPSIIKPLSFGVVHAEIAADEGTWIDKSVKIALEPEKGPVKILTIQISVKLAVAYNPKLIDFGYIPLNEVITRNVKITFSEETQPQDIIIINVEPSNFPLTISKSKSDEPQSEIYKIIPKSDTAGTYGGTVYFHGNAPMPFEIGIPCRWVVGPPLNFFPDQLFFPEAKVNNKITADFMLMDYTNSKKIRSITSSSSKFKVISFQKNSNSYKIKAQFLGASSVGKYKSILNVNFNDNTKIIYSIIANVGY